MLTSLAPHVGKLKFLLNENSPAILTGIGTVGTVATAYLTGRASFKAKDILSTESKVINTGVESFDDVVFFTSKQKVQLVWKEYIPAVGMGIITITSILLAHRISSKRIAALIVASGISERALQEYKAKVIEKLGPNKDRDVRDAIAQDRVNADPSSSEVIITEDSKVLCYDTMTGRYFRSSVEDIKRAENQVNHEIGQQLGVSFSRFCEEIGLSPTTYTDSVGWHMNNLLEVQFSTVMSLDDRPCVAISFSRTPSPNYDQAYT